MIPSDVTAAMLLAIQNTISRYCLALDTKDFSLLMKVFTKDMHADYSAVSPQNNDIRGLDSMIDRLMVILEGKTTHHALSTQILEFEPLKNELGAYECQAVTYFTADTFVDKNRTKEGLDHVSVFGRYEDIITEISPGEWRIRERIVKTFVSTELETLLFYGCKLRPILISINAASSHPQQVNPPMRNASVHPQPLSPALRTASAQQRHVPPPLRNASVRSNATARPPVVKSRPLRQVALKPSREPLEVLSDSASFFLPSSPES